MAYRYLAQGLAVLVLLLAGASAARAQAIDPHALFEQRCGRCHAPHAGDFARDNLERTNGVIVGRDGGRDLRKFLSMGHGKLTPAEVDVMVAHLTAILSTEALFREKCLICHDRAVVLARRQLIMKDGRLVGRYSGRDMAQFLAAHGRLDQDEIPIIVQMLERQLTKR